MFIAATSLSINDIVHACVSLVIVQNSEMILKLDLLEDFKPVLAVSLGYADEEENAKKHVVAVRHI